MSKLERGKKMRAINRGVFVAVILGICFSFGFAKICSAQEVKKQYFPEGTPTRAIQNIDDMLESYITKKDLTPEEQAKNRALKQKVLRGTLDIRELSRLALGKNWNAIGLNME